MIVSLIGSAGRAVDLEARFRRGRVILRDLRELHLPRGGLQMKCLKRFERVIVCILRRTLSGSYPFWMSPLVAISPIQPIARPTSRDVNTSAMLLCEISTTRDE